MVPLDTLAQITQRFEFIEAKLSSGAPPAEIAKLSREYGDLKPVVTEIDAYRRALDDLAEADDIFSKLMGDVVEPRREFIQANALNVENLDF